jgi:hypothetical protein
LPGDGDWIFSSTNQCESCASTQQHSGDLAAQFETPDGALKAFAPITTQTGRKAILEHAKEWSASIDDLRSTVRDKAKVILGATSFTFAVMSLAIGVLQNTSEALPRWAWILLLVLFFWVLLHFTRSLILSLDAITRDKTETVSTAQVIEFASRCDAQGSEESEESEESELRFAAEVLAAATRTHKMARASVNRVILAQASFVWGLLLLPAVFFTFILLFRYYPPSADPKWKPELTRVERRLDDAKSSSVESLNRVQEELAHAKADVARLQAAIERRDGLQAEVERRLDAVESAQIKSAVPGVAAPPNKAPQK